MFSWSYVEEMRSIMDVQAVEQQSSFHVDDILLIALKKIEDISCTKAMIYSGFYSGIGLSVLEEDSRMKPSIPDYGKN